MQVADAIDARRSIRGYRATPVPRETLARVLELAIRAPSHDNTQPWELHIVGGGTLKRLTQALEQKFFEGAEPAMDLPMEPFVGVYRKRNVELAKRVFELMGISRKDTEKRRQWVARMFRFFDAPAAIIVAVDYVSTEPTGYYFTFSIGTLTQNIALAALDFGLGTCADLAAMAYPDVVKDVLGIADSKKLVIGIAIGYPDWEHPANGLRTEREPLPDIATWHGL